MATNQGQEQPEVKAVEPGADYGLQSGFDPTKYEFYNPRTQHAPTNHAEESRHNANTTDQRQLEPEDLDASARLTPIRENDGDDCSIVSIKPKGAEQNEQAHNTHPSNEKSDNERSSSDESNNEQPNNGQSSDEQTKDHALLEQCYSWLFSRQHFQVILADPELARHFKEYIRANKPGSAPLLDYYLDSVKILQLMKYADVIARNLKPVQGQPFTSHADSTTLGFPWVVQGKLDQVLDALMTDDFPAFLTSQYLEFVDHALSEGVTNLQDIATIGKLEGLAEAFFLCNPTMSDSPIIYSSDEFHRISGHSRKQCIGQNWTFLKACQAPGPGRRRLDAAVDAEKEQCEILLTHRDNGSLLASLFMLTPLRDQSGRLRYYLGALIDVAELISHRKLPRSFHATPNPTTGRTSVNASNEDPSQERWDVFDELVESFSEDEVGRLVSLGRRKALLSEGVFFKNESRNEEADTSTNELEVPPPAPERHSLSPSLGFYSHYVLVRPYPSLRILFASSNLRRDIVLQKPFMNCISGSTEVLDELRSALKVGRKVTALVDWLLSTESKDGKFWVHCTPLKGESGSVGVWVIILASFNGIGGAEPLGQSESPRAQNLAEQRDLKAIPWETPNFAMVTPGNSVDLGLGFAVQRRPGDAAVPVLQETGPEEENRDVGGLRPSRRTYKSLSPYGILFNESS